MIGNKIRSLRENSGLTQQSLAAALSISRSAISLYEINAREPDLATVSKISDYFDVSADYLLDKSDLKRQPQPKNVHNQKLIEAYDNADEGTRRSVDKLLDL